MEPVIPREDEREEGEDGEYTEVNEHGSDPCRRTPAQPTLRHYYAVGIQGSSMNHSGLGPLSTLELIATESACGATS